MAQDETAEAESTTTPTKLFKCGQLNCGRVFKTKFSCRRHAFTHTNEKNFVCQYCHKGFALRQHFTEHMHKHTNTKPYVCGIGGCKERYRQASKLSLHRRTHPEYKLRERCVTVEPPITHESAAAAVIEILNQGFQQRKAIFSIKRQYFIHVAEERIKKIGVTTCHSNKFIEPDRKVRKTEAAPMIPQKEEQSVEKSVRSICESASTDDNSCLYLECLKLLSTNSVLTTRPILPLPSCMTHKLPTSHWLTSVSNQQQSQ